MMKLGKAPAQLDPRTIPLFACFSPDIPNIPSEYDFDAKHPDIPTPMFKNDEYGCCVIAARAHQTLRFEKVEQDLTIDITDKDVVSEYLRESGGEDSGLVMLNSLRQWREGWTVGIMTYAIEAYGALLPRNPKSIKAAMFLLGGIQCGVMLPRSAQEQMGKEWRVVSGRDGERGSWGGHAIFIHAYDPDGLTCVTWGKKQRMSWEFFFKYCDEAYGVVDSVDKWLEKPGIDVAKLKHYLREAQMA